MDIVLDTTSARVLLARYGYSTIALTPIYNPLTRCAMCLIVINYTHVYVHVRTYE